MKSAPRLITVGRITGPYGVRGWVKVHTYTDPPRAILTYAPWRLFLDSHWREMNVLAGRSHGKGVVAQLEGVNDRDAALQLRQVEVAILREQLATPAEHEYYWVDLIGLRVVTTQGVDLGMVDHLIETGANDVLVVKGEQERLIPFVQGQVVVAVNLDDGLIEVAWDPDY